MQRGGQRTHSPETQRAGQRAQRASGQRAQRAGERGSVRAEISEQETTRAERGEQRAGQRGSARAESVRRTGARAENGAARAEISEWGSVRREGGSTAAANTHRVRKRPGASSASQAPRPA